MDADRFDHLTRTLSTPASRRLALRGLGAALAASLGFGATTSSPVIADSAEDHGTVIADSSGWDENTATVVEPAKRPNNHNHDKDTRETCQPDSERDRCERRCNRVVNDGCGGEIRCTCDGDKVCAREDGVCCQPEQLCVGNSVCCPRGAVCFTDDACCPIERACFASDECCPVGQQCTEGGGTCCPLEDVCGVGGVDAACCPSGQCVNGFCI